MIISLMRSADDFKWKLSLGSQWIEIKEKKQRNFFGSSHKEEM